VPSRRAQISMSPEEVEAFLTDQPILNVATIGPTGHPHLVAMWFVLLDRKPVFWTFTKSQKVLNIRRDPKISALVESGDSYDQLRGVELVGTARLVEDYENVLAIGKAVGLKYTRDVSESEAGIAFLEAQATKRTGVVIDVERTVTWDHRKLGAAY
jgi:PPOX class probable F420-dependent enzyme